MARRRLDKRLIRRVYAEIDRAEGDVYLHERYIASVETRQAALCSDILEGLDGTWVDGCLCSCVFVCVQ